MKRIPSKNTAVFMRCSMILVAVMGAKAMTFQIPPDDGRGMAGAAEKEIAQALSKLPAGETNRIVLQEGIYQLSEPLRLGAAGVEGNYPLIIEAAPGAHPVLSGGVEIGDWRKWAPNEATGNPGWPEVARGNVWVAEAPRINGRVCEFRQLWVNDTKGIRARHSEWE